MALSTVTVTWDENDPTLAGLSGTITFTLSARLDDATDGSSVNPIPQTYSLALGTSKPLVANDNSLALPTGTFYNITVQPDRGQPYVFQAAINHANGATQKLSSLVPLTTLPAMVSSLPLPSGTATAGLAPVATGTGEASAWGIPSVVTVSAFLAQGTKAIAHRGLPQVAPEHTMVSYRAAIEQMLSLGLVPAIKLDVYQLGDLSLGVMHDGTVDRTTTSSGPVGNYGAQSWKTVFINGAQAGPAWGSLQLSPPLLSEVFNELGGKCVFVIEPKSANPACLNAILTEVTNRKLASSVIITSEDTTLTLPGLCKAAGVGFWYYWLQNPITGPVTPAQAAATPGVTALSVAVNQLNSDTDANVTTVVSAAHAVGILATGFTYTRRYDYQRALSFGIDVHGVNDVYAVTSTQNYLSDRFFTGAPVAGEVGSVTLPGSSASAPSYSYAGSPGNYRRQMTPAEATGGISECLGFMCPVPNAANSTWTFTGTVFWDVAETSTTDGASWASILVCAPDDRFTYSNAFAPTYQCFIRQGNGSTYSVPTLQIYKTFPGAYQNNGSYAQGSVTQMASHAGTAAFVAPNTLGASYAVGTVITSLTLGSAITAPAGMKIALPNGQIATISLAVSNSATVSINSLTVASSTLPPAAPVGLSSGQAVSFGIPFSVQVNTQTPGQTTITFKRTDTNDTATATDTNTGGVGPYNGGYVHIGKSGAGAGSTQTLSYAQLTIT